MKTKGKIQHVVPLGRGWAVKTEGGKRFTVITTDKGSALSVARGIAKNKKSGLFIHGRDGKIQRKEG